MLGGSELGDKFVTVKTYRKLRQEDIAAALGISRPKVSALEKHGQGATYETIDLYCRQYRIDPRWFFGQLQTIEEADLDLRTDSSVSTLERIEQQIKEIQFRQAPSSELDPIAAKVMSNPDLYSLAESVRHWDGIMLRRLKDIAMGLEAGRNLYKDQRGAEQHAS